MNLNDCHIDRQTVQKLLSAGNGDVALLYLYIDSGNDPDAGQVQLRMTPARYQCAAATLRQLGLWPEEKPKHLESSEHPKYSEQDVLDAVNRDREFKTLYGEIQSLLGRTLNVEELKILLGFVRYLGLPTDVVCVLVHYCRDQARQRGKLRNPSLRTIEKEAYAWAERGIDTLEAAAAFIQSRNQEQSRLRSLLGILQIRGRELTAGELRYAQSWLDMAFADDALAMAYERTCLNTGGLNWAYMNKILESWHKSGFHSAGQIAAGDTKKTRKTGPRQLDSDELAALEQMMKEG